MPTNPSNRTITYLVELLSEFQAIATALTERGPDGRPTARSIRASPEFHGLRSGFPYGMLESAERADLERAVDGLAKSMQGSNRSAFQRAANELRGTCDKLTKRLIDTTPGDLVRTAVAVAEYQTSRATIKRDVGEKRLLDHRANGAAKNATFLLSRSELSRLYTKRG